MRYRAAVTTAAVILSAATMPGGPAAAEDPIVIGVPTGLQRRQQRRCAVCRAIGRTGG